MKKTNVINWELVEELAGTYKTTTDEFEREDALALIFDMLQNYVRTSVRNATSKTKDHGLTIPAEDFESQMLQAVWKSVESFEVGGEHPLQSIIIRRISFAEKDVARNYRRRSNDVNDKDGYTYEMARWDSINRQVGGDGGEKELGDFLVSEEPTTEDIVIKNETIQDMLDEFETLSKSHKRHALIIRYMLLGYESDELAIATGLADSYNSSVRKFVSRAKEAFKKYMEEVGE